MILYACRKRFCGAILCRQTENHSQNHFLKGYISEQIMTKDTTYN